MSEMKEGMNLGLVCLLSSFNIEPLSCLDRILLAEL
jgi:hypothetical protein